MPIFCDFSRIAKNSIKLADGAKEKFEKFIQNLEDSDDVQNVYHNAEY